MFLEAKIASAQTFSKIAANPGVRSLVDKIIDVILVPIIQVLFVFTFLIIVWGIFKMITHGEDSKERSNGQQHILWGAVGMFIMISAYGIIRLIGNTVGVGDPFL